MKVEARYEVPGGGEKTSPSRKGTIENGRTGLKCDFTNSSVHRSSLSLSGREFAFRFPALRTGLLSQCPSGTTRSGTSLVIVRAKVTGFTILPPYPSPLVDAFAVPRLSSKPTLDV
jgi:hypothetical protein